MQPEKLLGWRHWWPISKVTCAYRLFSPAEEVARVLQSKDICTETVHSRVNILNTHYLGMRSEASFHRIYEAAENALTQAPALHLHEEHADAIALRRQKNASTICFSCTSTNKFTFGAIFFAFGPYYEGNICVFLSRAKRYAFQTNIIILRPKKKNCNQIWHNRDQNDMHSN